MSPYPQSTRSRKGLLGSRSNIQTRDARLPLPEGGPRHPNSPRLDNTYMVTLRHRPGVWIDPALHQVRAYLLNTCLSSVSRRVSQSSFLIEGPGQSLANDVDSRNTQSLASKTEPRPPLLFFSSRPWMLSSSKAKEKVSLQCPARAQALWSPVTSLGATFYAVLRIRGEKKPKEKNPGLT